MATAPERADARRTHLEDALRRRATGARARPAIPIVEPMSAAARAMPSRWAVASGREQTE
jgi:hypothetical protein